MKKVFATLAVGLLAVSAFAQGTLNFGSGAILARYASGTGIAVGGGQVQFAWAPVGTSYTPWTPTMTAAEWTAANAGWSVVGSPAGISPVAGRFSGGVLTIPTATAGAIIQGVVIGWTGTGAANYLAGYTLAAGQAESATTHQFGITSAFTVDTADPANALETPAAIGSSTATPYAGLTLANIAPIPEPSSFALAGLGAAALLIFRRRK